MRPCSGSNLDLPHGPTTTILPIVSRPKELRPARKCATTTQFLYRSGSTEVRNSTCGDGQATAAMLVVQKRLDERASLLAAS